MILQLGYTIIRLFDEMDLHNDIIKIYNYYNLLKYP